MYVHTRIYTYRYICIYVIVFTGIYHILHTKTCLAWWARRTAGRPWKFGAGPRGGDSCRAGKRGCSYGLGMMRWCRYIHMLYRYHVMYILYTYYKYLYINTQRCMYIYICITHVCIYLVLVERLDVKSFDDDSHGSFYKLELL